MKAFDIKRFKSKIRYLARTYGLSSELKEKIIRAAENSNLEQYDVHDDWISVKDRLPEKAHECYLCYFHWSDNLPDVMVENIYCGEGRWMNSTNAVTHWRPMLKKPIEFEYAGAVEA